MATPPVTREHIRQAHRRLVEIFEIDRVPDGPLDELHNGEHEVRPEEHGHSHGSPVNDRRPALYEEI